eukprot:PhM_4_TR15543/c0_g1_i1/m.105013
MKVRHIIFALCCITVVCRASGAPYVDDDSDLPDEVRSQMFDEDNPNNRQQLLCSACHWSTVEVHDMMKRLQDKYQKKPRQDILDDALDELCETKAKLYGISVPDKTKKARPRFTRMKSRVDGGWVTRIFLNECTALLERLREQKRGTWKGLNAVFQDGQIRVGGFLAVCPACEGKELEGVYHPRMTSRMWMPIKDQLKEDWELSPDL